MTKTNDFRVVVMMAVVALAVSAAALMLAGPPASAANKLVVDNDKVQCENASFTSIQGAVDAAGEGDLIRVCPGEYHESVVVDKQLTLAAEDRDALDALECFDPAVATLDPTRHTIVDPSGDGFTEAFKLEANSVDLSGFVVQGASVGIDASDSFSGYRVHHNLIRLNTLFGMDFGSEGTFPSRVDHNCIRDAAPTTDTGTTSWGLVSELDDDSSYPKGPVQEDGTNAPRNAVPRDLINASIDHNSTFRNQAALEALGPGRHDQVTFANNVSRQDGTSIAILNSKGSRIVDNELISPIRQGISVGGANDGLEIARNVVTSGTNGILFGLPTAAVDQFTEPTTNATVSGNTLTGQTPGSGIVVQAARPGFWPGRLQQSEILNNTANGNTLDGIQLQAGNSNNEVRGNTANNNGRNGIRAFMGATGNTFEENSMHVNGWNLNAVGPRVDARDDNPLVDGALQNVWLNNDCDTDFPAGRICGV